MSINVEFFTLQQAAEFLGCDRENIKQLVASYRLKCGVFVPGWTGHALPASDGKKHSWEGGVCDIDSNGKTYSYRCSDTGEKFKVRHGWIAQFWYLHGSEAYRLATTQAGHIDVDFLEPEDGEKLHRERPEHFPWPVFQYWIDSDQEEPRRITWERIWFRRSDILEIAGAEADSAAARRKRLSCRADELGGRDEKGRMRRGIYKKLATEEGFSESWIKQLLNHHTPKQEKSTSDNSLSGQLKAAQKK